MHDFVYAWGPPAMGAFGLVIALWLLRTIKGLVKVLNAISDLAAAQLSHNGGSTLLDRVASIETTLKRQAETQAASETTKAAALTLAADALRAETHGGRLK